MVTAALLAAAVVGMICHWYKKYFRKQTSIGLVDYIAKYPKHTLGAIATTAGSVVALVATGIEVSEQTLAIAFGIGFTLDSAINKAPEES